MATHDGNKRTNDMFQLEVELRVVVKTRNTKTQYEYNMRNNVAVHQCGLSS